MILHGLFRFGGKMTHGRAGARHWLRLRNGFFSAKLATFKWLLEKILSCDIVFFYWVGICQTLLCTNDAAGQNWDRETAKLVFIISDHLDFPQDSAGQIEKLPFWLIQASPRNRIFCLDLLCNQPQLTRTDFMDHINGNSYQNVLGITFHFSKKLIIFICENRY